MAVEFKLPKLGEGVDSGDVLEVLVSEGDTIKVDDGVVELETDKATVIVSSEVAGVVSKINCAEGDTLSVGDVILTVEPANEGSASTAAAAPKAAEKPAAPEPPAQEKPPVAEQTPTAPAEAAPPANPAEPVESVAPPKPTRAPVTAAHSPPVGAAIVAEPSDSSQVAAGPAIRRLAREVGVDLTKVQGSGERGRILREDVLKVVREGSRPAAGASSGTGSGLSDGYGPVRIEKMPKIRQTIARKMHESWTTCPRVTNFDDADVTSLEQIRQKSKQEYAAGGLKLTTMPFLVKAVSMALKSHPVINASVDLEQGQIIYKDYVNVGIAVDTERGLVVPSLRGADKLGIPDIARQLGKMADDVRTNNFSIEDLRGGTFTISNLGAIGGTYSTPIINTPETAILLVGRSRKLPVVVDDEVKIRLMMPLSLSYDHRLIDGGAAARFLNEVIGYLESPSRLLLAF
jgi:pyruvate/2-oxoglutarate dehydrogenase complex dihydrolipoamide acyltransferase (E2) component